MEQTASHPKIRPRNVPARNTSLSSLKQNSIRGYVRFSLVQLVLSLKIFVGLSDIHLTAQGVTQDSIVRNEEANVRNVRKISILSTVLHHASSAQRVLLLSSLGFVENVQQVQVRVIEAEFASRARMGFSDVERKIPDAGNANGKLFLSREQLLVLGALKERYQLNPWEDAVSVPLEPNTSHIISPAPTVFRGPSPPRLPLEQDAIAVQLAFLLSQVPQTVLFLVRLEQDCNRLEYVRHALQARNTDLGRDVKHVL